MVKLFLPKQQEHNNAKIEGTKIDDQKNQDMSIEEEITN